jgi:sarcosine oxidase subunit gamma
VIAIWTRHSPLAGEPAISTLAEGAAPGVRLIELAVRASLLVTARRGAVDGTISIIRRALDVAPPTSPRAVAGARAMIAWSGPGRWLVMSEAADGAELCASLTTSLAGMASCIDQTDASVRLELSGPGARRSLMKLVGIDVHPAVFKVDDVALTPVAHIGAHLWRRADADGESVFEIASPRSSAGSLWHAIVAAASELGLEARPLQPQR